jgi:hypothetical protein
MSPNFFLIFETVYNKRNFLKNVDFTGFFRVLRLNFIRQQTVTNAFIRV